jgi:NitT/TauT family transport system ATP-binding protein
VTRWWQEAEHLLPLSLTNELSEYTGSPGIQDIEIVARPRPARKYECALLGDPHSATYAECPEHQTVDKIRIEGLNKTYVSKGGRITALAEVNLTVRQDEFVTLVGPSGCGKSTLLKLIGTLIRPSRGVLLYDGEALAHPPRDVGIVFQEAVLLP